MFHRWGYQFGKLVPKVKPDDVCRTWKILTGDTVIGDCHLLIICVGASNCGKGKGQNVKGHSCQSKSESGDRGGVELCTFVDSQAIFVGKAEDFGCN